MKLYLDTSALVKLYVDEEGSALVRSGVGGAEIVATSEIAYLETRSALARRRREKVFSPASYRQLVEEFEADWDRYLTVSTTMSLLRGAAALAERYPLRAYDALHLASARLLRGNTELDAVTFATWDGALEHAASREGFALLRGT
ncbi:MAG: type II toxin-antitoxin system VapC family toxin [Acidobacteriota bacterium]|nr:type II toxin-antitoxin system VapC family toxin [Acidobacteriota bacterium]